MTAARKTKNAAPGVQTQPAGLTSKSDRAQEPKQASLASADYYSTPATLRKLRMRQGG